MSNTECTVTIADIYGAEWWSRNKAELEREWEWGFGVATSTALVTPNFCYGIAPQNADTVHSPRIILHRRKPKPPTLREVYGVDSVRIPIGKEWTGEWTNKKEVGSVWLHPNGVTVTTANNTAWGDDYRLILRERPKKVWFKCEAEPRVPRNGDWFYSYGVWGESTKGADGIYLCATRHEDVDQTVQVVTQAMVDGVGL